MAVSELKKGPGGAFLCPVCGEELEFADGGQVRVVGGVVDFDNVKPRHICRRCGKFYRELLNTGYYDVFALEPEDEKPVEEVKQEPVQQEKPAEKANPVVALQKNDGGDFLCPNCQQPLVFADGGAVRVVNGRVDYENVKPRYICQPCKGFYRELLASGLYEFFDLPPEEKASQSKPAVNIKKTGDLAPMQLKRDAQGRCECPRCGADMRFVEAGAVKVVDGKVDMSDTVAHFECDACVSVYRRIATTDYFQWSEK